MYLYRLLYLLYRPLGFCAALPRSLFACLGRFVSRICRPYTSLYALSPLYFCILPYTVYALRALCASSLRPAPLLSTLSRPLCLYANGCPHIFTAFPC